jgi:hypothetical protein
LPNSRFTNSERVRENRLRRVAERRGFVLSRSRRRDPLAVDYGTYTLFRKADGHPVGLALVIDEVEALLVTSRHLLGKKAD